jgi:hypothetical protein
MLRALSDQVKACGTVEMELESFGKLVFRGGLAAVKAYNMPAPTRV